MTHVSSFNRVVKFTTEKIELHPLPEEGLSSGISNDILDFLSKSTNILGSSNGLILCFAIDQNQLFVGNPVTKSWFPIPTPDHLQKYISNGGFVGFECDSSDWMVFLFYGDDWSNLDCIVYLSKEGVWKTMEKSLLYGGRNLIFDMPVHHNGAIYFISDCFPYFTKESLYFRPYIISYNFEDGSSRMLRVPKEARKGSHDLTCDMKISKWGKVTNSCQSICLVRLRKHVFTIWILTNYESSKWKRILKVRVKAMGMNEKDPIIKGFVVLNGDLLVIATKNSVYGYGLTNEKYMIIEKICEHEYESYVHITSYSNTLCKCGIRVKTLLLPSHTCSKESVA
ncbi:F-box protein At3g26010-like [Abrus precatorius]|uniref:F-box protein At3g26010-like n=1 Tax=Abrus precatorius TaxID=3816 RepID=A0A8B8JUJ0_ABRPR|nr:F-box protein At3g26010-like [Abrus precatorius]